MNVATFTLTILFSYLIILKFVSYFAYKASVSSTEDYFLSKRNVGMFALVATTMASIFSTGTVVSAPSEFFTKGTGYFWIFFFALVPAAMIPFVIKFWKLGKTKGFVTPGDLLGDFFQSRRIQFITAIIGILSVIPYATAQLVAVGKTFEALTEGTISYSLGVSIVCLAIGVYLYYGGSRAVIWTDVVQGVIFSTLLIISGFLVVHWAGGWESMLDTLSKNPEQAVFKPTIHYYEYLPMCLSFFLLPYVWQRMYMARSATTVAKNVMILPIVFIILFFVTWVIGTSALTFFPEGLADGDNVLGAIFKTNAPYFGALVLVAAFAAGMSTVDSQLLSAGAIVTHDIRSRIKKGKEADPDDESSYQFARRTTIVLLVLIYIWSLTLQSRSVLSLIVLGVSLTLPFVPCVFGLFYWKRSSEAAAFWSLLISLFVFILKEFTALAPYFPTPLGSASWALISAAGVFVLISLCTNGKALDQKRAEYNKILSLGDAAP